MLFLSGPVLLCLSWQHRRSHRTCFVHYRRRLCVLLGEFGRVHPGEVIAAWRSLCWRWPAVGTITMATVTGRKPEITATMMVCHLPILRPILEEFASFVTSFTSNWQGSRLHGHPISCSLDRSCHGIPPHSVCLLWYRTLLRLFDCKILIIPSSTSTPKPQTNTLKKHYEHHLSNGFLSLFKRESTPQRAG